MAKKTAKQRKSPSPEKKTVALTPGQKRLFTLLMAAIPVLFFVLLEGILVWTDYGLSDKIFTTFAVDSSYYAINPKLGQRYFPGSTINPSVAVTDVFLKRKPADSYRIFVLGGSTTAGYPYLFNGSFSSILKAILHAYYPEKYIEVVNLAMPAVSSYTVRDIALRLAPYHPDLLLIYTGHNEFYGGLGVGSSESLLGNSRWLILTYLKLSRFRTFQLVKAVVQWIFRGFEKAAHSGAASRGTLMERLAGKQHIPYGSKLFHIAGENFQKNMEDVVDYAEKHHIPVMIGTLVSNIHDQPPFVDVHGENGNRAEWESLLNSAKEKLAQRQYPTARQLLEQAVALDSLPASPYFLLGQVWEALGDTGQAYRFFYKAKEFDGLRFRASEDLNRRIRNMGTRPGVTVVPIQQAFEVNSPGGIPGKSLFLEHLHPNVDGYVLMAKTFASGVISSRGPGVPLAKQLPDSAWLPDIGITEVDRKAGDLRIRYLKMGFPFTHGSPPPPSEIRLSSDPIDQLVLRYWRDEISWERMHVEAAQFYREQKQLDKAGQEYRALIHATPMNDSPYLFLAQLLTEQHKSAEAIQLLDEAAERVSRPEEIYKMLGKIYLNEDHPDIAALYWEAVCKAAPHDAVAHLDLAFAYWRLKKYPLAQSALQTSLKLQPDLPEARKLAKILGVKGKSNNQED